MKRADITLSEQFEKRKNWKRPLVDAVVATIIFRSRPPGASAHFLDAVELFVVERVKGAEKAQIQAHHGGFMDVNDVDTHAAASRELREETGYMLPENQLHYFGSTGPAIYRSALSLTEDKSELELLISDVEAEPSVGFALPLFWVDVTSISPTAEIDHEVTPGVWMSPREIIAGNWESRGFSKVADPGYSRFNYYHYLWNLLLIKRGVHKVGDRMISQPGIYRLSL